MAKLEHDGPTSANGGNLSPLSHAQSMDNLSGGGSTHDDEVCLNIVSVKHIFSLVLLAQIK